MNAPIRFVNGTAEDFIAKLRKRPRGRPKGTIKNPIPSEGVLLKGAEVHDPAIGTLVFGGDYNAHRTRMEQLEQDFQARCKPVAVIMGTPAMVEAIPSAPRRLAAYGQGQANIPGSISTHGLDKEQRLAARADAMRTGEEVDTGSRPWPHEVEREEEEYSILPVVEHLHALGLAHVPDGMNGPDVDCRNWLQ